MEHGTRMELQEQDGVFVLHMNGPENRFNPTFIAELHRQLDIVEAHDGPTALVIAASGKIWSNGLDLEWLGQHPSEATPFLLSWMRLMGRLLVLPVPTVAATNKGHAFAGGMIFAMCTDYRVMREDRGYLCMPEIDLRMPLAPGMAAAITGKITDADAVRDIILWGKRLSASEALKMKAIDDMAPLDQVKDRALAVAEKQAKRGTDKQTMGKLKREVYADAYTKLTSGEMGYPSIGAKL